MFQHKLENGQARTRGDCEEKSLQQIRLAQCLSKRHIAPRTVILRISIYNQHSLPKTQHC